MHDRRKFQRFKMHDSCIIHHANTVGTIIDISMGGFACMCLDQNECHHFAPSEIDIYCREKDLWAKGIRIRVLGSKTRPGAFIPDYATRICRLCFNQLDENQRAEIENIIVQYSLADFS